MKEKPSWKMPWWEESTQITRDGVVVFDQDARLNNQSYSSKWNSQNAILVTWWNVTIIDTPITKTWNWNWDNSDFYGTNAAVIAIKWNLELNNVTIDTNWSYANAVFSYWEWNIQISDSTIKTKDKNSWWIMVTWWGKLTAKNVNIITEWNSSAAIRSDRGGWTLNVDWWEYTTNWLWSPAIYSTADITVENAKLTSTKSEWAIVEWKNSITLINTTITDSNTALNWKSTTYKNIFLYQSMSWDADEWTAKFTAKNSKIITNKWDTIYVTNTTAEILLENNEIVNNDWDFLRIESAAWWKTNENGWDVSLNLVNQNIKWDIIVDNISSLNMEISEWSSYEWAINTDNQSQNISINLDSNSSWTLTANSYISEITSSDKSFTNLNLNWFSLYIWEEECTSIDQIPVKEIETTEISETTENIPQLWANPTTTSTTTYIIWWLGIIIAFIISGIIIKKYIKKE